MTDKTLRNVRTPAELANLLGLNYRKHLIFHLYRVRNERKYFTFQIKKKSGGTRTISAPATHLKSIQRKLAEELSRIYEPKSVTNGFVKDRGIVTNARPHVGRRWVLNLDLRDFFGTINFGRVRGLFLAIPYELPESVATILAQICCHDNKLPQGAPTSPIISNMICAKLDSNLRKIARTHSCHYTRYADDLTFSCNRRTFPSHIARVEEADGGALSAELGKDLLRIIEENGFEVNALKTTIRAQGARQLVTGLVVNRKINVDRRFIRTTRAMLNSWARFGLQSATALHYSKNPERASVPEFKQLPSLDNIIRGRLSFIQSVRGNSFSAYLSLARKFNGLTTHKIRLPDLAAVERTKRAVVLITNSSDLGSHLYQGTGFLLSDVGLVTCCHVVEPPAVLAGSEVDKWFAIDPTSLEAFQVKVIAKDKLVDLAILAPVEQEEFLQRFPVNGWLQQQSPPINPEIGQSINLVGFPSYEIGQTVSVKAGHIVQKAMVGGHRRFNISSPVVEGNSGGPVLDSKNYVIGVAVTGVNGLNANDTVQAHSFIPIAEVTALS